MSSHSCNLKKKNPPKLPLKLIKQENIKNCNVYYYILRISLKIICTDRAPNHSGVINQEVNVMPDMINFLWGTFRKEDNMLEPADIMETTRNNPKTSRIVMQLTSDEGKIETICTCSKIIRRMWIHYLRIRFDNKGTIWKKRSGTLKKS